MRVLVFSICILLIVGANSTRADWPQWGGPTRNFKVSGVKLRGTWESSPPRLIWQNKLGDGYSSILAVDGRLFTMYRFGNQEHVVALAANSGKSVWSFSYDVQFLKGTDVEEFGPGPLATPLIIGDKLFTVRVTGALHCLDRDSGKLHWQRHISRKLGGTKLYRGYSASPIVFRDTVILPVGGKGRGVVAFRISDGSIQWQKHDFSISHVSPILVSFNGRDQLIVLAERVIMGIDPATGRMLWKQSHPIAGGYVSSTPVWNDKGRVFFSAAYGNGSRCLQLAGNSRTTTVKEAWHNGRMRVHHSNVIRVGNVVYGSSGDFSALLFTALDLDTGKILWQERELGRANCVYVDDKSIVLREDGTLMLATINRKGMTVHSNKKLFDGRAWTCPTLDGKRLYIRNRKDIMALELP